MGEAFIVNRVGYGSNSQDGAEICLSSTVLVLTECQLEADLFDHVPHVVLYSDESLPAFAFLLASASQPGCSRLGSCRL